MQAQVRAARATSFQIFKGQALPRAPVRAEGVEPSFSAPEADVLPLDEARSSVGSEGIEPSPSG